MKSPAMRENILGSDRTERFDMKQSSEKTILYRYFNDNNDLLYIGITKVFGSRLQQHLSKSRWFLEATKVTLEHFESRPIALMAEESAIKSEKPLFNTVHNKSVLKDKSRIATLAKVMKDDFFYKLPDKTIERKQFIETLRTENGAWRRKDLERLGVPWPPPKGWKSKLISTGHL
jgi:predicted GIY-YIG superfamily endonuclease